MRTTAIGLVAVATSCLAFAPAAHAQRAGAQPPGSYAETCRDSRASNGVLSAQCLDARGRLHSSTLGYTTCRGDIANINGALSCNGGAPSAGRSGQYYPQGGEVRRAPRDRGYGSPERGYDRNYDNRDQGRFGPSSGYDRNYDNGDRSRFGPNGDYDRNYDNPDQGRSGGYGR